jgi:hypothetical protein
MSVTPITNITTLGIVLILLGAVLSVLPVSPFHAAISSLEAAPGILQYINWICPVSECAIILEAWLTAFAGFYTYSLAARLINLIS